MELVLKCACGNIYECKCSKFIHREQVCCQECSQINKGINSRYNIDFIKSEFIRQNYIPLFDEYENCETPLFCSDNLGYKGYLSYANLKFGYSFGKFKMNNPYILYNMKHFIKINDIDVELLEECIADFYKPLMFMCECGKSYATTWSSFVDQKTHRCQICSKKKSRYAKMTEDYFNSIGISYSNEISFNDCKNVNALRFDYIITINDKFLLIEVDGQFHYKNMYGIDLLENQKFRDNIKDEYCLKNNIHLLRIPYWEYKNDNYKKIIGKEVLKFQSI